MINWNSKASAQPGQIDKSIVIGVFLSFSLIAIGMLSSQGFGNFFDWKSVLIVLGGTLGAAMVHFSLEDMQYGIQAVKKILFLKRLDPQERIRYLVNLAQEVRVNGILHLERESQYVDDPFLRTALDITVDGQPHAEIKAILETEMHCSNERSCKAVHLFETMGAYAPAMGLIGTLIGLIQMLNSLSEPAKVGPAMAVALVTTFYGAILSNLILLPLAGKLKNRSQEERITKAITIEGVLALGKQENPLIVAQKLNSFLPLAA